ncbi:hypothetical protein ACLB1N_14890 [Escherichia coli]
MKTRSTSRKNNGSGEKRFFVLGYAVNKRRVNQTCTCNGIRSGARRSHTPRNLSYWKSWE